jgi:thiamine biosynthesis protein ThiI
MAPFIVIHYAEIGLKGRNRSFFENQLLQNVRRQLAGLPIAAVERRPGRLMVTLAEGAGAEPSQAAIDRLRTVPGIAYLAPAYRAPKDVDALARAIIGALAGRSYRSFRVNTHRADKSFPMTSPEIDAELGHQVQDATGWAVDLHRPELIIHVELLFTEALFYLDRVAGLGGLPVGVSGTVGLLLSGGIDSPVAGFYALKRGCEVVPIHFHSGPFGNWLGSEDKVRRLVEALEPYGLPPHYYVVPIGESQQEIAVGAPAGLRILLYRRLMVRIAEALMSSRGGLALVTGESLGQVASQTLPSLRVVEAVAGLPLLRPLIGLDKAEIIVRAQALGTYEISIEAGDDCCQFLMPRQVVTRPSLEEVDDAEANLDVPRLVAAGLAAARLQRARA